MTDERNCSCNYMGVIAGAALKSKVGLHECESGEKAKHISFAFISMQSAKTLCVQAEHKIGTDLWK